MSKKTVASKKVAQKTSNKPAAKAATQKTAAPTEKGKTASAPAATAREPEPEAPKEKKAKGKGSAKEKATKGESRVDRLYRKIGTDMRAVIYARVSSQLQKDKHTIASQLSTLPRYVAGQAWTLVKPPDTYVDDGRTAKAGHLEKREGWKRLARDMESGGIDIVVVVDQDRIFRCIHRTLAFRTTQCNPETLVIGAAFNRRTLWMPGAYSRHRRALACRRFVWRSLTRAFS